MAKAIKEIIILLLACLLTMLVLALLLYKYIPSRKVVPEIAKYKVTEEIQDLLEDDIDSRSDKDDVILTYEVTSSDLKNYQSINAYVPGKANPFATAAASPTTEAPEETTSEEEGATSEQIKSDASGKTKKVEEKNYEKSNGTK